MPILGDAAKTRQAVVVHAADESEARKKAAQKLGVRPSNVSLESKGKGKYSALPTHAEGDVHVSISSDRMEAKVTEVVQPLGDGGWPSAKALEASIRAQGVANPDGKALLDLAEKLAERKSVKGLVVARGEKPVEPKDASIKFEGDVNYPVLRGDNVGKKIPVRKGRDGIDVMGKVLPPEDTAPPKDIELPDKYFALETKTGEFSAKGYGLLKQSDGKLSIKPLLKVSDNKLTIKGAVYHKGFTGEPMTFAKYRHLLTQMGVAVDPEENAILQAINKAREEDKPQEKVVLAQGQAPTEGREGSFEVTLDKAKPPEPEKGDVDHRERSSFVPVKAGETIGVLHPPVYGEEGVDVFGNKIKPREVKAVMVKAGDGVDVSADGRTFTANSPGMVSWQGGVLSVADAVVIHGDVDYNTGNVRLEKGSVRVRGTVRDGFVLTAPGDVSVGESIEGAKVTSQGGCVEAGGGIITGETGKVVANRDVKAQFAENAVIQAGGDVIIAHNISNCDISAGGKVLCVSGKGLIQGGVIRAAKGVECKEVGSEYGIKNKIYIGPPDEECKVEVGLLEERKCLRETVEKIDAALGQGTPQEILERMPPARRPKLAEVIKARMAAAKKIEDLEERIRREFLDRVEACAAARFKFRIKAWPGTSVHILGRTYTIDEPMDASTISFNPRTMEFEVV